MTAMKIKAPTGPARPAYPTRKQFSAKARKLGLTAVGISALAAAGCQTPQRLGGVPPRLAGEMPAGR